MEIHLTWAVFKTKFSASLMRWVERDDFYHLFCKDQNSVFTSSVLKDAGADQVEFEASYKNLANDPTILPSDSDGSHIIRYKTTKTAWHYEPRCLDFYTSKYESLYNRKHDGNTIADGTDIGDASLAFFDASGGALSFQQTGFETESNIDFQGRLTAGCVRTHMDWQPNYDMDIIGGIMMIKDTPAQPAYSWTIVAPDIPAGSGGSVPHVAGGWNLQFFNTIDLIQIDGRGVKTIYNDQVYNSNKFRTIVKHAVGAQIGMQIVYEHFKA